MKGRIGRGMGIALVIVLALGVMTSVMAQTGVNIPKKLIAERAIMTGYTGSMYALFEGDTEGSGNLLNLGVSGTEQVTIANDGALNVESSAAFDGDTDEIQLLVSGYTTQTNSLVVFEQSDGTDEFVFTNAGVLTATAGVVAPDLTASDDLVVTDDADVGGTLNFGANDLYPVGYGTDGEQIVTGTDVVTGTLEISHGLTTVTWCVASMGSDPDDDAGDAAHVTVAVAANACTVKLWQDDFVTAATEADIPVHWMVIGTP